MNDHTRSVFYVTRDDAISFAETEMTRILDDNRDDDIVFCLTLRWSKNREGRARAGVYAGQDVGVRRPRRRRAAAIPVRHQAVDRLGAAEPIAAPADARVVFVTHEELEAALLPIRTRINQLQRMLEELYQQVTDALAR
ncbi:hypothetical protein J8273_6661 [Carpediemonas membranifera]|uniref:Uncharacterized protein n=1 Tax=Carpediemonas membranifera TaxID=201153 RepID=A0A8J6AUR0_9EUKA|nr:hypothetical protein J8273_6661 [Carpediemonas membranifera]|eukprot:KAG9392070.1 hypothetical protein J8273_6661 [Carpediemonas membranifera]